MRQVACGADGAVWALNTAGDIFRRIPGGWAHPGNLSQISVGAAGQVYGVNPSDMIYRFTPGGWGRSRRAASGRGGGRRHRLGAVRRRPDLSSQRYQLGAHPGGLRQIAVGSATLIWGVNSAT